MRERVICPLIPHDGFFFHHGGLRQQSLNGRPVDGPLIIDLNHGFGRAVGIGPGRNIHTSCMIVRPFLSVFGEWIFRYDDRMGELAGQEM